jgi:hypothetical protein
MKVLIDTTVWSLALRKTPKNKAEEQIIKELVELIRELRVVIVGPVRQELLTGISNEKMFNQLRQKLQAFDDAPLDTETYELAAEHSNRCRRHGAKSALFEHSIRFYPNGLPVIPHLPFLLYKSVRSKSSLNEFFSSILPLI